MTFNASFWINSVLLGVGLAMDAFSVSAADAMKEPDMSPRKRCAVAGTFAFFQCAMPLLGWVCVHTIASYFEAFQKAVPWIAVLLLGYLGIRMLLESRENGEGVTGHARVTGRELVVQGIATSIDALSVGFAIEEYSGSMAVLCAVVIAGVTFVICVGGLEAGRRLGMVLRSKANILGGCILLLIGVQILLRSF